MLDTLLGFCITNLWSIFLIGIFIIACIYLWKQGYKKNVSLYILTLIVKAELQFEHGANKEKLESVITGVYDKFPKIIKFFYTRDDLVTLINNIVAESKEWLQNQTK